MTRGRAAAAAGITGAALALAGCVTSAEFRALEKEVIDLQRAQQRSGTRERVADISTEMDELRRELGAIQGRLDVIEKRANDALEEVKATRREVNALVVAEPSERAASGPPDANAALRKMDAEDGALEAASSPQEVAAYREAYAAWREGRNDDCVDLFRVFLRSHAESAYADDAAFWMADCHFKQGDYKRAALRFDDVVRTYPGGNKAPEALYRQGVSLLKLGPKFQPAARKAFERVVKEYPDSSTAQEAGQQLEALGG